MLTLHERHRVMKALEASDLVQVGDQHLLLIPVDEGILEALAVWGAEDADDEDNHDQEQVCEDEGAEIDDEGAPGFLAVPPEMARKARARPRRYLDVKVEL